jgi:hypothetical protein
MDYAKVVGNAAAQPKVRHDAIPLHHVAQFQGHSVLIDLKAVKPTATKEERFSFLLKDLAVSPADVSEVYVVPTTQLLRVGFRSEAPMLIALEKLRAGAQWAAAGGRKVSGWAIQDLLTKVRINAFPQLVELDLLTTHLSKFGQVISAVRGEEKMIPGALDGSVQVTMKLGPGKTLPQFIYMVDSGLTLCDQLMLYTDQHQRHCYRCGLPSHIGLHCKAAGRARNAPASLWSVLTLPEGVPNPNGTPLPPSGGILSGGLPTGGLNGGPPSGGPALGARPKTRREIVVPFGQSAELPRVDAVEKMERRGVVPVERSNGPLQVDAVDKMESSGVVPVEQPSGSLQVDAVDKMESSGVVPVEQPTGSLQEDDLQETIDDREAAMSSEEQAPSDNYTAGYQEHQTLGSLQLTQASQPSPLPPLPEDDYGLSLGSDPCMNSEVWPSLTTQQFRGETQKRSLSLSPSPSSSPTPNLPGSTSFRSPKTKTRRSRSKKKRGTSAENLSEKREYTREDFLKQKSQKKVEDTSHPAGSRFAILPVDQPDDGSAP